MSRSSPAASAVSGSAYRLRRVDQQWNGVRRRVAVWGTRPSSDKVFGSLGHRWTLEDPLADDGLAELEAQLGVRWPLSPGGCLG